MSTGRLVGGTRRRVPAALLAGALISAVGVPAASARIGLPPDIAASYQLGGAYKPELGVGVVARDRTEQPSIGRYNICYVNGFQTQPGTRSWWKKRHPRLLLRKRSKLVVDSDWGEVLLDTSSRRKRKKIARIVGRWTVGCANKGYQAVEFDNLDSFTRSRNRLSMGNNSALAKKLVRTAHRLGLAAGQKNTAELGARGRTKIGFDFAVAEECQRYAECDRYLNVYGSAVIEIEYTDYSASYFTAACADHGAQISIIRRDRQLRTPSDPAYRYQEC
ncbi:MAG: endo alpha-1,4 polygalactosaminidase [Actinobacteria bacterium]|nr:endo alpha-1,4 polygalactosaminidase [Actinomycetota bacterium]